MNCSESEMEMYGVVNRRKIRSFDSILWWFLHTHSRIQTVFSLVKRQTFSYFYSVGSASDDFRCLSFSISHLKFFSITSISMGYCYTKWSLVNELCSSCDDLCGRSQSFSQFDKCPLYLILKNITRKKNRFDGNHSTRLSLHNLIFISWAHFNYFATQKINEMLSFAKRRNRN